MRSHIKKGMQPFIILVIGTPEMFWATKRFSPTGGVIIPTAKLAVMITPRCTGSTFIRMPMGQTMGASIVTAPEPSMNMPAIRKRILIKSRKVTRLAPIETTILAKVCGTWAIVSR